MHRVGRVDGGHFVPYEQQQQNKDSLNRQESYS